MKFFKLLILLFLQITSFSQQVLMPYRKGKLWGYADTTGKIVVTPQFDEARLFFDDIAYTNVIQFQNNKVLMGVVKNTGQIIIPPSHFRSYDLAARNFDFHSNTKTYLPPSLKNSWDSYRTRDKKIWKDSLPVYFFAKRGNDYGIDSIYLFDSTGKQLTQTPVHEISVFSYIPHTYHFLVTVNNKMGVLNQEGKTVIPILYDRLECIFYEKGQYYIIAQKENKFGLIDMQHKIILPIVHNELRKNEYGHNDGFLLVGRKDKNEMALMPNGKVVQKYVNGKINVYTDYEKNNSYKLQIDTNYYKNGNVLSTYETGTEMQLGEKPPPPAEYRDEPVKQPSQNIAFNRVEIVTENNKKGVKQKDKILIVPEYDSLFLVSIQDSVHYYIAKKKNKYGIIGTNSAITIPLEYKSISLLYHPYVGKEKYFLVENNKTKMGIRTLENKEIVPFQYEQIELRQFESANAQYNTLFHCNNKNGTSLIRLDGTVYMKTSYSKMNPIYTSSIYNKMPITWLVENKEQQKGIIDTANNILLPVQYKDIQIFYVDGLSKNQSYFKVKNETNKIGLFDIKGQPIIPIVYESIYQISDIPYNYNNQQKEAFLGVSQNNLHGIINIRNEIKLPIEFNSAPVYLYRQLPYFLVEKKGALGMATFENPHLIVPDSSINLNSRENDYTKASHGIFFYTIRNKKENNLGVFIIKNNKVIKKIPAIYDHDWGGSSSSMRRRYFRFLALSRTGSSKIPYDYIGYNGVVFFED